MQCHAMNNEVLNNFIKSATAASNIGALLIITNLFKPRGAFYPFQLLGNLSVIEQKITFLSFNPKPSLIGSCTG